MKCCDCIAPQDMLGLKGQRVLRILVSSAWHGTSFLIAIMWLWLGTCPSIEAMFSEMVKVVASLSSRCHLHRVECALILAAPTLSSMLHASDPYYRDRTVCHWKNYLKYKRDCAAH